jgi:hypothetical protein
VGGELYRQLTRRPRSVPTAAVKISDQVGAALVFAQRAEYLDWRLNGRCAIYWFTLCIALPIGAGGRRRIPLEHCQPSAAGLSGYVLSLASREFASPGTGWGRRSSLADRMIGYYSYLALVGRRRSPVRI